MMNRMGFFAAAGGQTLWTPADHSTAPRFWIEMEDASDYLLNGDGTVNTIYDRSGNGFDLVRDTGYAAVDFDATDVCAVSRSGSVMTTPTNPLSGTTGGWVGCFVFEAPGVNGNTGGTGRAANNVGVNWGHSASRQLYIGVHGWGTGASTSNGGSSGQWSTNGHLRRYNVGQRYCVNGGTRVTIANAANSLGTNDLRFFRATSGTGGAANQRLKAACYFMEDDYDDTNGTLAKLEGYFAHKYGFASELVSGHPYKTNPPYL